MPCHAYPLCCCRARQQPGRHCRRLPRSEWTLPTVTCDPVLPRWHRAIVMYGQLDHDHEVGHDNGTPVERLGRKATGLRRERHDGCATEDLSSPGFAHPPVARVQMGRPMRRTIPRQSLALRRTPLIASLAPPGLLRYLSRVSSIGLAVPFVALASPPLSVPVPAHGPDILTGRGYQQR